MQLTKAVHYNFRFPIAVLSPNLAVLSPNLNNYKILSQSLLSSTSLTLLSLKRL